MCHNGRRPTAASGRRASTPAHSRSATARPPTRHPPARLLERVRVDDPSNELRIAGVGRGVRGPPRNGDGRSRRDVVVREADHPRDLRLGAHSPRSRQRPDGLPFGAFEEIDSGGPLHVVDQREQHGRRGDRDHRDCGRCPVPDQTPRRRAEEEATHHVAAVQIVVRDHDGRSDDDDQRGDCQDDQCEWGCPTAPRTKASTNPARVKASPTGPYQDWEAEATVGSRIAPRPVASR